MTAMKVTPDRVLLTTGRAATFSATDENGNPIAVSWTLNPAVGSLSPVAAPGAQSQTISYVSPTPLTAVQTIALVANLNNESATASIDLTPEVAIIPDRVELRAGESQRFIAIFAAAAAEPTQPPPAAAGPPAGGAPAVGPPAAGAPAAGAPAGGAPAAGAPAAGAPAAGAPAAGPAAGAAAVGAPAAGAGGAGAAPPIQPAPPPVATAPEAGASNVTWILSPELGTIDQTTGTYSAPDIIEDSATVTLFATLNGRKGQSTIKLIPFPWKGWSVNLLGVFLLLVFFLVAFLIGLWPPNLPSPEIAMADRLQAEKTLELSTTALTNAQAALTAAPAKTAPANKNAGATTSSTSQKPTPPATQTTNSGAATDSAQPQTPAPSTTLSDAVNRAQADKDQASADLARKQAIEDKVKDPCIETLLCKHIDREIDLLLVVLLGGALGSFLHIARSYTEFAGNERLKASWTWWYCLAPFTGAILALVFYAAVRGGFLAINAGATVKASDLNAYAVVSIAALVGMFSKEATNKLGDVIDTAFQSKASQLAKDKLNDDAKASTPAANTPAQPPTSGSAASGNPSAPKTS